MTKPVFANTKSLRIAFYKHLDSRRSMTVSDKEREYLHFWKLLKREIKIQLAIEQIMSEK